MKNLTVERCLSVARMGAGTVCGLPWGLCKDNKGQPGSCARCGHKPPKNSEKRLMCPPSACCRRFLSENAFAILESEDGSVAILGREDGDSATFGSEDGHPGPQDGHPAIKMAIPLCSDDICA